MSLIGSNFLIVTCSLFNKVALAYAAPITIRVMMIRSQPSHQISESNEDCGDVSHDNSNHRHSVSMSSILKPLIGFMMMKSLMSAMAAKEHQHASLPKTDLKLKESRQITFQ